MLPCSVYKYFSLSLSLFWKTTFTLILFWYKHGRDAKEESTETAGDQAIGDLVMCELSGVCVCVRAHVQNNFLIPGPQLFFSNNLYKQGRDGAETLLGTKTWSYQ